MANEFKLSYTASQINEKLGEIDNLAKKSEVPSKLSQLVNDGGFATESYVDSAIENIDFPETDLSGYALKSEIPTDYLTEIPAEYVTEVELTAKGYLTQHQSLEGLATEQYVTEGLATKQPVGDYALKSEIPTDYLKAVPAEYVTEYELNSKGYLTEHQSLEGLATETYVNEGLAGKQPIGDYALKSEIPTNYLTEIPAEYITEVELNAKGYLTEHQSLEGLATEAYVNTQIAAIPTPDVSGQINTHNTATDSHNDIRLLVEGLTNRLNTLANSDDTTLDQMSEVVDYIKNNKTLIDGITTNKINVADIINNLTSNVSNKPLSAAQGVVLKGLIDTLSNSLSGYQPKGDYALRSELPTVPTKVSAFTNDAGYLTQHQDISGKLDVSELPTAINTALAQAKTSGEFDGKDGAPGEKGDKGDTGAAGKDGVAGYTPVRGTDYWTEADKAEIKSYVDEAILGGAW